VGPHRNRSHRRGTAPIAPTASSVASASASLRAASNRFLWHLYRPRCHRQLCWLHVIPRTFPRNPTLGSVVSGHERFPAGGRSAVRSRCVRPSRVSGPERCGAGANRLRHNHRGSIEERLKNARERIDVLAALPTWAVVRGVTRFDERETISRGLAWTMVLTAIAAEFGWSVSAISHEVPRNCGANGYRRARRPSYAPGAW
jgi:hypothetical protein